MPRQLKKAKSHMWKLNVLSRGWTHLVGAGMEPPILLQSMISYIVWATYCRMAEEDRAVWLLIRKHWQVRAWEAATFGFALQGVYIFLKRVPGLTCQIFTRMTRVQASRSRTPSPRITVSANLAHHKAEFQPNELFSCALTLFLFPWLRTLSPKSLMGHLSSRK